MKNAFGAALFLCFIFSFVQLVAQSADDAALKEIADHRKKQFKEFKDKSTSPLPSKDVKRFSGLNYFPIDLKYRVQAKFVLNASPVLFKMKTTTTRLPNYRKYGEVQFTLDGQNFVLEVYQSPDLMKMPGYEDYLFIPFTDSTNGDETYEVGRYLEFRVPNSEDVVIDFNLCYNPYCSYGKEDGSYSCPIPPAANALNIPVRAGELKYH
ncbi:DUF1684 domain-containing protein [Pseudochryseolinea flava]|uniref:DUF1684 domain-containing protein n=1 Tax=Pseudochryseolinea flava TaxID=2059302 RepID=A0A364XUI1_9BACT|nr:DUF1684 domain-containing protein [Pseudochryseolinea flava]RAV97831.1 hypothetical protein DQQ10_26555 [Pseudochryseolinea flava]